LRRGEVVAAITGEPKPVPGCRVVRLGRLRYAAVATAEFHAAHFADGVGSATLAEAPIVAFDRNDSLQHDFVRKVTRRHLAPPATYLPSVREFDRAIRVGMGWGLLPESDVAAELEDGSLVELVPGRRSEVALFWQHWRLGSTLVADLTEEVVVAARRWMAS
jgi:LysR family transcriptional regulator (chromosome initiation inhibitor)